MRVPFHIDLDVDHVRRRLITALAGALTGSALALTLVQFSAARERRARQTASGAASSRAARMRVAA